MLERQVATPHMRPLGADNDLAVHFQPCQEIAGIACLEAKLADQPVELASLNGYASRMRARSTSQTLERSAPNLF